MCSCLVCTPRKEACTQARFFHFFRKATLANVVEAALYYCCWEHNKEVMLDTFITSRVRRKIIVVYAKYPDFKTHVRGLAKLIKEDAGNIQRELKRLEKIGFLISERQGNTKIYYTNKQFPIFKELQSIVLKSQRVAAQKRQQRV
jgi:DNA-binding MarR family transcriptional regulator